MHRHAGFSLVELLCAILILGIGLVGLMQGVTAALRSSKESEWQTTAALLAAGQIETLRADGFVIEGEVEGESGDGLELYYWKQSVTKTIPDGLYEVTIEILNANSGKPIYELKTWLFDAPLSPLEDPSSPERNQRSNQEGQR